MMMSASTIRTGALLLGSVAAARGVSIDSSDDVRGAYRRTERPVPGNPALTYFLPRPSTPTRKPFTPALIPTPDLLKFRRTPGRTLMDR